MDVPREGGCQCGEVRYEIGDDPLAVIACHCTDCQKQSGSAFGMSMVVKRDSFRILKGEAKSFSRAAGSGASVECFFCPSCGTRLFHQPSSLPVTLNVKPGTLDDPSWRAPVLHCWTSRRQSWVVMPEGIPSFEKNPTKP